MKNARLTIALCLSMVPTFASTAFAQTFLEPPEQFDRPYPGGTSVYFFPKSEMWERCNDLAGRKLPALPAECGKVRIWKATGQKRCFVFVGEQFKGTRFEQVLIRHGRAHCNGWWHLRRKAHAQ